MSALDELHALKAAELEKIKAELNRLEDVKRALLQRGLELQGAIAALLELKGSTPPPAPVVPPTDTPAA
jgi:hypothetical protein